MRWREVTSEPLELTSSAKLSSAGDTTVQLVRTVPQGVYESLPRGDYRILEAYVRALRSAKRLIYIENQFLWSPEIIEILSAKLADPPSDDFRLVVLLPVRPNNGADVTRGQAGELARVDDGAGRFVASSIYAQEEAEEATPVYVHSKICIVDDEWLSDSGPSTWSSQSMRWRAASRQISLTRSGAQSPPSRPGVKNQVSP
jgi:phosphatidylserine/phosphatidylglycerophosphate/cardiolipin synthase-like enzyme